MQFGSLKLHVDHAQLVRNLTNTCLIYCICKYISQLILYLNIFFCNESFLNLSANKVSVTINLNMFSSFVKDRIWSNLKGNLIITLKRRWKCKHITNQSLLVVDVSTLSHRQSKRGPILDSALEQDSFCILHFQETIFSPTNTQYLEVDLSSSLRIKKIPLSQFQSYKASRKAVFGSSIGC